MSTFSDSIMFKISLCNHNYYVGVKILPICNLELLRDLGINYFIG